MEPATQINPSNNQTEDSLIAKPSGRLARLRQAIRKSSEGRKVSRMEPYEYIEYAVKHGINDLTLTNRLTYEPGLFDEFSSVYLKSGFKGKTKFGDKVSCLEKEGFELQLYVLSQKTRRPHALIRYACMKDLQLEFKAKHPQMTINLEFLSKVDGDTVLKEEQEKELLSEIKEHLLSNEDFVQAYPKLVKFINEDPSQ